MTNIQEHPALSYAGLSELRRVRTGWITPNKGLVVLPLYRHLEIVKSDFVGLGIKQEYKQFEERIDQERSEYIESIPEDEHPEWHNFEMYEDNERTRFMSHVYDLMYENGWGRVGLYKNSQTYYIELQYNSKHSNLESLVQEIAEMIDHVLVLTPVEKNRK